MVHQTEEQMLKADAEDSKAMEKEIAALIEEREQILRTYLKMMSEVKAELQSALKERDEAMAVVAKAEASFLKIVSWLKRLEANADQQAKTCNFKSLKDALVADAKNYKATRISIEPVLTAIQALRGKK